MTRFLPALLAISLALPEAGWAADGKLVVVVDAGNARAARAKLVEAASKR